MQFENISLSKKSTLIMDMKIQWECYHEKSIPLHLTLVNRGFGLNCESSINPEIIKVDNIFARQVMQIT